MYSVRLLCPILTANKFVSFLDILNNTGNALRTNSSSTASVVNTVVTNELNSLSNQRQLEGELQFTLYSQISVQLQIVSAYLNELLNLNYFNTKLSGFK